MTDQAALDYKHDSIRESLREAGLEVYGEKELEAPDAATVLLEAITGELWVRVTDEEKIMQSIDTTNETCECDDSCPNADECCAEAPKKRKTRSDKGVKRGPRADTEARELSKAKAALEKQLAKEVARNEELNAKAEAIDLDLSESDQKIRDLQRALGIGDDPETDEAAE